MTRRAPSTRPRGSPSSPVAGATTATGPTPWSWSDHPGPEGVHDPVAEPLVEPDRGGVVGVDTERGGPAALAERVLGQGRAKGHADALAAEGRQHRHPAQVPGPVVRALDGARPDDPVAVAHAEPGAETRGAGARERPRVLLVEQLVDGSCVLVAEHQHVPAGVRLHWLL